MPGKSKKNLKKSQYLELLKQESTEMPAVITKKSQLRALVSAQQFDGIDGGDDRQYMFDSGTTNHGFEGTKGDAEIGAEEFAEMSISADAIEKEQVSNGDGADTGSQNAKSFGDFAAEGGQEVTLADKIMAQLGQPVPAKHVESDQDYNDDYSEEEEEETGVKLPPKVIAVYSKVGQILSTWTSGQLPRAFKIIPTLKNWEDVLYVTEPEGWSPQAVYEATKLFVSSLDPKQSQKFVFSVLLDRFRDELSPTNDEFSTKSAASSKKTLNYHTYRALIKSLYKPAAFFKGFIFPLTESGTCTIREATIAASILARVSVPVLHASAALMRLAEYEYYSAPTSLFIKVLLDKKYSLPYKAIDAIVFHFVRFKNAAPDTPDEKLPILWHQSLLVFVQRYKNDITSDQRGFLLDVLKVHYNPQLTPEIRKELLAGKPRDEELAEIVANS